MMNWHPGCTPPLTLLGLVPEHINLQIISSSPVSDTVFGVNQHSTGEQLKVTPVVTAAHTNICYCFSLIAQHQHDNLIV